MINNVADQSKMLWIRVHPGRERFCWGVPDEAMKSKDGYLMPDGNWVSLTIADEDFLAINELLNSHIQVMVAFASAVQAATRAEVEQRERADAELWDGRLTL